MTQRADSPWRAGELGDASAYVYEAFVAACLSGIRLATGRPAFFPLGTLLEYNVEEEVEKQLLSWASAWRTAARREPGVPAEAGVEDLMLGLDDVMRSLGLTFTKRAS